MTDHEIGLLGLVLTALAAAGTWLALPQIQGWRKRRDENQLSPSLNLGGAVAYRQVMPPGIAEAAERTLAEITDALPEGGMVWLHEKDFGSAFPWKTIEFLEKFTWQPQVPAREFLDVELESLRVGLVVSAKKFVRLVADYTDNLNPASDQEVRKIPDQRDEHGKYSDQLFFKKQKELNYAAEGTWNAYQELVRRARLKVAHSDVDHTEGSTGAF